MGQALTQMPQAIHLAAGVSALGATITFMGQASTHLPQEVHSFLLIIYTPVLGFWVMAPDSQTLAHLPHWMQVIGLAAPFFSMIWMQDRSWWNSLKKALEQAETHSKQAIHSAPFFTESFFIRENSPLSIIFLLHYTPNFFKYQWLFDNIFTVITQISCLSTLASEILLLKS